MATAAQSRDFKLFVDNDDATPVKTEVEGVQNVTISPGKGVERVVTKSDMYTYQTDAGFSATADVVVELPLGAGQALIWGNHQAGTVRKCYLEGTLPGSQSFEFNARFAVSSIPSPERGVQMWSLEISADEEPTYSVVA